MSGQNTSPFYWSVRRELWESRYVYLAPLAAAAVLLAGFLITSISLPGTMRSLPALDVARQTAAIASPYDAVAGSLMLIGMAVGAFYCLNALQSERRDRSILFWKSLPVSDRITLLSKAIIPIILLPLVTFAVTFTLQAVMLLASSFILSFNGLDVAMYWNRLSFPRMSLLLLYHLVTVHGLWHAPFYGWLLLVSAWAKRFAFLWAALPVLAIGGLEKLLSGTSYFFGALGNRVGGGEEAMTAPDSFPMDPMTHLTFGHYLISPGLWIGLGVTAVFLVMAMRLRHYREPI